MARMMESSALTAPSLRLIGFAKTVALVGDGELAVRGYRDLQKIPFAKRVPGEFLIARQYLLFCATLEALLIGTAMGCSFLVDPVRFFVTHAMATRHFASRTRLVDGA